jgi:hypothetical protein
MNMQYYAIGHQSLSTSADYANGAGHGLRTTRKAVASNSEAAAIRLPSTYLGLQLVNQSIIGPMYSCPIANNLTYDFAGLTNGVHSSSALTGVPYLYAFCFENGTRRSLVLINTDFTNTHTLSFGGDNPPSGSVTQRQYAPAPLDDGNESPIAKNSNNTSATVSIETSALSNPRSITLPPHSVTAVDYTAASELDVPAAVTAASTIASALPAPASSLAASAGSDTQSETTGTPVINCPAGFSSSGSCGTSLVGSGGKPLAIAGSGTGSGVRPYFNGTQVVLIPTGYQHSAFALNYTSPVNVQAFVTTFNWIPNGQNGGFVLQNNTITTAAGSGGGFFSGAGCEGGFYQAFGTGNVPPSNIFALDLDSANPATFSGGFTYSTAQIYQQAQSPCNPNDGNPYYYTTNKISTYPVPLTSPASTLSSTTGDTYSTTLYYTGTTLVLYMYDVTAGGSCPGASCFTQTWDNVNIPAWVNGTTAYAGFVGGTNFASPGTTSPLVINSLVYTVLSPAATPSLSPVSGTYSSTQSVTISDPSSGAIVCYDFVGQPATNGTTGCTTGTLYTGAISVPSGRTVYAVAGGSGYGDSGIGSSTYDITATASMPEFSADSGAWQGHQNVQLTAVHGGVICYNTTGSPATNGSTGCTTGTLYSAPVTVSSNETLYAVAGGTGFTDSAVNSAAYTINPWAGQAAANSPTFSPVPGAYSGSQSVTLASTTPSSYICYIEASSPPSVPPEPNSKGGCSSGTLYSGPVSVPSSKTIYAVAGTTYTGPPSSLVKGAYTINQGNAPSCSPTSGISSSPIAVTCSNSNSGTTIMCYTENGTQPVTNGAGTGCTTGTALAGASGNITISSTTAMLNVVAGTSILSDSTVSPYGAYTIGTVLPTPTFSPAAGSYTTAQSVAISDSTAGATIYYTTNGTAPTTSSTVYTVPITVSSTETLQAIAVETGFISSPVDAAVYAIGTGSTAYINYPSGGFTSGSLVLNGGATITTGGLLQLTDGGLDEARSAWFPAEVPVQSFLTDFTFQLLNPNADGITFTIQSQSAEALGDPGGSLGFQGITPSVAVKFDLHNNVGEGSDSTGLFTDGADPTLPSVDLSTTGIDLHSGDMMNAQLVYDGTDLTMTLTDTVTSAIVTEVFPVNIPSLLGGNSAWVGFTGGTGGQTATQNVLSWSYVSPAPLIASTPTFSPAAGAYTTAQSVIIGDATAGTTIYYTTNGTTPTTSSTKYTGGIAVNATETIEAIAVGTGYANSTVATGAYTISYQAALAAPTPGLGTVLGTTNVDFQWSAGTGVTLYQLCLSTVAAGECELFSYKGTALSTIVPSLPANGVTMYAALSSYINGAWQQNNYLYTESGKAVPAVLQSPTPGLATGLGISKVGFQWNTGTGVTLYQFCLSTIEPGACDLFSYKGTALSATVPSLPANGATMYATLWSMINGAWQLNNYLFTERGPAVLQSPTAGLSTVLGATNVNFHWSYGGGITAYEFCLSTIAAGECDLFSYKGTAVSVTVPSLPTDGVIVYASLYSAVNGAWQQKNYLYTESGTPIPAVLQSPTPELISVLGTTNVGFQWTAGTGVTLYQFCLSTIAAGECEVFSYKGTGLSAIVPSLPANCVAVYATLSSMINGAWRQSNYLYTESGIPVSAALQSPTPGLSTVLGTTHVGFQWNAGKGVTIYQLCLSTIAPGECDVFSYKGAALSATVPSLPANDEKVYATLWSDIQGTWQQNNYLYTESGSPAPAVLQSPTPGLSTVLGTTNVGFKWSAGSGVTLYQFCLSTIRPGACDLFTYKGAALSASVPILPANGVTVYATLWSDINGVWQQNNYHYTEQ